MADQPQQPEPLAEPMAAPPGRPRGKALRLTGEQIEAMAEVDQGDVPAAQDLWRRHAPNPFKSLTDAPKE